MRHRIAATAASLLSAAVLLTACGANPIAGGSCNVSVSSADLVKQRQAAGIADCSPATLSIDAKAPAADLPDTSLGCLGSSAKVALSDIKGPAIVNFWSSSCGPCRKETPAMAAFAKQYAGQVSVIGVDFLETYPGAAIDFAHQSGVTYPLLADPCGALQTSDLNPPNVLPFTYVVAADGTVSEPPHAGGLNSVGEIADLAAQHGITLKAAG